MEASLNEHGQFEVDAFRRPQPVKVSESRCDVLLFLQLPSHLTSDEITVGAVAVLLLLRFIRLLAQHTKL